VCLTALSSESGVAFGYATSASDGTYTITNLAPDSYTVESDPTCSGSVSSIYPIQFLPGVSVTSETTTTGQDFTLVQPPGAPIIGTATGASSSATVNWTAGSTGGLAIIGYTVTAYDTTTQVTILDACPSVGYQHVNDLVSSPVSAMATPIPSDVAAINNWATGDFSGPSNSVTPSAPLDVVTFSSPPTSALTTDSVTLVATGSIGDTGVITFSSSTPSVCSVDASSGVVTFTGTAGLCTVTATQGPTTPTGTRRRAPTRAFR